jgi:hypothetical protein
LQKLFSSAKLWPKIDDVLSKLSASLVNDLYIADLVLVASGEKPNAASDWSASKKHFRVDQ